MGTPMQPPEGTPPPAPPKPAAAGETAPTTSVPPLLDTSDPHTRRIDSPWPPSLLALEPTPSPMPTGTPSPSEPWSTSPTPSATSEPAGETFQPDGTTPVVYTTSRFGDASLAIPKTAQSEDVRVTFASPRLEPSQPETPEPPHSPEDHAALVRALNTPKHSLTEGDAAYLNAAKGPYDSVLGRAPEPTPGLFTPTTNARPQNEPPFEGIGPWHPMMTTPPLEIASNPGGVWVDTGRKPLMWQDGTPLDPKSSNQSSSGIKVLPDEDVTVGLVLDATQATPASTVDSREAPEPPPTPAEAATMAESNRIIEEALAGGLPGMHTDAITADAEQAHQFGHADEPLMTTPRGDSASHPLGKPASGTLPTPSAANLERNTMGPGVSAFGTPAESAQAPQPDDTASDEPILGAGDPDPVGEAPAVDVIGQEPDLAQPAPALPTYLEQTPVAPPVALAAQPVQTAGQEAMQQDAMVNLGGIGTEGDIPPVVVAPNLNPAPTGVDGAPIKVYPKTPGRISRLISKLRGQ